MGASHRGAAGIAAVELDGRWTPEQAAEYAARRDFRLAQLLASDPRARATARWLGLCSKRFQGYGRHHGAQVDNRAPQRRAMQTQTPRPTSATRVGAPNSAQRRSQARAAAFYEKKKQLAAVPMDTQEDAPLPAAATATPTAITQQASAAQAMPPPPPRAPKTAPEKAARLAAAEARALSGPAATAAASAGGQAGAADDELPMGQEATNAEAMRRFMARQAQRQQEQGSGRGPARTPARVSPARRSRARD